MEINKVVCGDCLVEMGKLEDNSVDSIVTDPPYGLSFMGKHWDYDVPQVPVFREMLRILKPGGHLLCFGGSRTFHRIAVNIEDAGFDIRDTLMWIYGSGFPKSHNIKEGEFKGWGTALKPAHEPIIMARKPLEGTVADNVLKWGTGAINVDGCRVETKDTYHYDRKGGNTGAVSWSGLNCEVSADSNPLGRWPANVIHDGSEEVLELFPNVKSGVAVRHNSGGNTFGGDNIKPPMEDMGDKDSGSAARFFYCAKASKKDRDDGCYDLPVKELNSLGNYSGTPEHSPKQNISARNNHPTVKPTTLMSYLCRLVTPSNGIVLDPFSGSGSTGKAAIRDGFRFIGFEREAEYCEIANKRINYGNV